MAKRTSIVPGIVIGSIALSFVVAITVGWNVIFPFYYEAAYANQDSQGAEIGLRLIMNSPQHLLKRGQAFGDIFLVLVILALTFFLTSSIRRSLHIRRQLAFIDTITHELKTPLTSLSLSIDTFRRRNISDDLRENIINRMDQDIKRLTHFIQHVIEANRIEHGDRGLLLESVHLNEVLKNSCERIQERYQLEDGLINCQLPDEDIHIQADAVAIESIILNLIDNAVKYSPDNIHVNCVLSVESAAYCITFTDIGIGLSPQDIKHIFDRFTRVSKQSQISGSGLGLYLVKQLAQRMQMDIQVSSNGIGTGSQFVLRIPIQDPS